MPIRLSYITIKGVSILLFLMFNSLLFSQQLVPFSGIVVDEDAYRPLDKAIVEINSKSYSVSNLAQFSLYVELYDTIVFTHLGYLPLEIVVSDSIVLKNLPRVVGLKTDKIILDEVRVTPNILTEEMILNAKHNVQVAGQNALKENNYDESVGTSTANEGNYSGMSTSQMVGLDLIKGVQKIKEIRKSEPKKAANKIVSYEEYSIAKDAEKLPDTLRIPEPITETLE